MQHLRILGVIVAVIWAAGSMGAQERTRTTLPVPVRQVKPAYTAEAMQAGKQGSVLLEAVVLDDGKTGDVNVVKSLDTETGLDQQALDALKRWTWKPGTRDGKPTTVVVTVEMTFTLRQ